MSNKLLYTAGSKNYQNLSVGSLKVNPVSMAHDLGASNNVALTGLKGVLNFTNVPPIASLAVQQIILTHASITTSSNVFLQIQNSGDLAVNRSLIPQVIDITGGQVRLNIYNANAVASGGVYELQFWIN